MRCRLQCSRDFISMSAAIENEAVIAARIQLRGAFGVRRRTGDAPAECSQISGDIARAVAQSETE